MSTQLVNPKCLGMDSWTIVRITMRTRGHSTIVTEYIRNSATAWQESFGESLEYVHDAELCAELEAFYQANKAQFGITE